MLLERKIETSPGEKYEIDHFVARFIQNDIWVVELPWGTLILLKGEILYG